MALVIVFVLLKPALKAATTPAKGAQLDEVVDGAAALPQPESAPALAAPQTNDRLEAARRLAKENPAAVANIVRGWVNGEVS